MSFVIFPDKYVVGSFKGKGPITVCVLKILSEYTDADHPMTSSAIIARLEKDYSISCNRNTVGRSIADLRHLGVNIETCEDTRGGYYLDDRLFEPIEIRWLADSIINSRQLTSGYAEKLLKKLKMLSVGNVKGGIDHLSAIDKLPHHKNQIFSANMLAVDEAIERGGRIHFTYGKMECGGRLQPDGGIRTVLPLHMFLFNRHYYLVAYDYEEERLNHFRLDRIMDRVETEEPCAQDGILLKKYRIDPVEYAKEHPHMYGGRAARIQFKMPQSLAGAVYDAFGDDAEMKPDDSGSMTVTVKAAMEGMRFFALQYGPNCEVLSPPELREIIKKDIIQMMEKYSCGRDECDE